MLYEDEYVNSVQDSSTTQCKTHPTQMGTTDGPTGPRANPRPQRGQTKRQHPGKSTPVTTPAVTTSPLLKKPHLSDEDFPPLQSTVANSTKRRNPTSSQSKTGSSIPVRKDKEKTGTNGESGDAGKEQSQTPQVLQITGKHPPKQVSPFQALAKSITAVQTTLNEKISTVQSSVDAGINTLKKLLTQPVFGLDPHVTALERCVPSIKQLEQKISDADTGIETRLKEVELTVQSLSVVSEDGQSDTVVKVPEALQLARKVDAIDHRLCLQESNMDVVVSWAGAMHRAQASMKK